jgi:hypothetical protein
LPDGRPSRGVVVDLKENDMAKRLARDDFAQMLSFGTFKPVGYTVLAYAGEDAARGALERLKQAGVRDEDVLIASSENLFGHVKAQMPEATGMIGSQGYEVVLMKRYLGIAQEGGWWLMVWSPEDADVARIKSLLAQQAPLAAAHYGRIMIEDLTEPPVGVSAR